MSTGNLSSLFAWVVQHPFAFYATVFLAAFAESLVAVGLIVPGAVIVFCAGAIIATGSFALWNTLAWAASGAFVGAAVSYWQGRHYGADLQQRWPFNRYPSVLARSTAFFHRYGGASIFLGRFLGSIRPAIPAVAGMLGMSPLRFCAINLVSVFSWALVYTVLGIFFGAAVGLAGTVATRLALILVLLLILLWGGAWVVIRSVIWLRPRVELGLIRLQAWAGSTRFTRTWFVRGMVAALLDPTRPEYRVLLVFAVVLIAAAWTFAGIIEDVVTADPLVVVDKWVYQRLQGLRTPLGDSVMIAITQLGDAAVILPVIIVVLVWLCWKHAWRALVYWLAAASFAAVLTVVLKAGFGLPRPLPLYDGSVAFGFPSGHAAMSIVVFGFLAAITAREFSGRGQLIVFTVMVILAGLIAFSRLYLGVHWMSDVLGGLSFGVAWVALLGMAYLRRPGASVSARGMLAAAATALIVSAGVHAAKQRATDTLRYAVRPAATPLAEPDWWNQGWQNLPAWRIDIEGEYEQPLSVQWAGSLDNLRARLVARGWHEALPLTRKNLLFWLDTRLTAMQLPLLPRVHDGHYEALALVYPVDGKPDQRMVLRLWSSEKMLQAPLTPIWVGTVTEENISRPLGWFNLPMDSQDFNAPRRVLFESLSGLQAQLVNRNDVPESASEKIVWDNTVLLTRELE